MGCRVLLHGAAAARLALPRTPRNGARLRGGHTTHYSLLTTHYSLLTTHYSLLTTHYSLGTIVVKTHTPPSSFNQWSVVPDDAWVFASSEKEAKTDLYANFSNISREVKYVQVKSQLVERGMPRITADYGPIFALSDKELASVQAYLELWDPLRVCCGSQMSETRRAKLLGREDSQRSRQQLADEDPCNTKDIDAIERAILSTEVFKLSGKGTEGLRAPSIHDAQRGAFNGSYCSWFDRQVVCQTLKFNEYPQEPYC